MATDTQERAGGQLVESNTERSRRVSATLEQRIDLLEQLLPDGMKGQGPRLIKRAMLTFSRNEKLQRCSTASFIQCVLSGAEIGLAIDGRLAHAVPYNCNVAPKGQPADWQLLAQFQPDYKGLIVVARRSGEIVDASGDVVCKGDHYRSGRAGPRSILEHSFPLEGDRGEVMGAYAIIKIGAGDDEWRYEQMTLAELDAIRERSKSKDKGPWVTDTNQMRIKTVLKRGLKLYCNDPTLARALELDDEQVADEMLSANSDRGRKVGRSDLNDTLRIPTASRSEFEIPPRERQSNDIPSSETAARQDDSASRGHEAPAGSSGPAESEEEAQQRIAFVFATARGRGAAALEKCYADHCGPDSTMNLSDALYRFAADCYEDNKKKLAAPPADPVEQPKKTKKSAGQQSMLPNDGSESYLQGE